MRKNVLLFIILYALLVWLSLSNVQRNTNVTYTAEVKDYLNFDTYYIRPFEVFEDLVLPTCSRAIISSRVKVDYSVEDIELLSRLVYTESRGEPFSCKLKVASVVVNRVFNDEWFPNTIPEVIYQYKQFGKPAILYDKDGWEYKECLEATLEVLTNGSVLDKDVMVFYAYYVENNWVNTREIYCQDGTTIFAYIYAKSN